MSAPETPRRQVLADGRAFRDRQAFLSRFVLSMALAPPHHTPSFVRRRDRWTPVAFRYLRGWRS